MAANDSSRGGTNAWARPVLLAVSCIVIGFVIGWFARGDGGGVTLPPVGQAIETTATVAPTDTTATSAAIDTMGTTATVDTTGTTGTTGSTISGAPSRDQIKLVVLNGTATAGLAAKTQSQAQAIGYVNVGKGNAAVQPTTIAYYRTGQDAAAKQVAADLGAQSEAALVAGSTIESAAVTVQPDVDVVLVLGG
ncbi:MAG: LytR C-terminal domain-containing protein [Thermoleophilia bacterium]